MFSDRQVERKDVIQLLASGTFEANRYNQDRELNGMPFPNGIAVIGAGYVGLTTAVCLAAIGYDTFCYESDIKKVEKLGNGISPISEPNVQELLQAGLDSRKLSICVADVNMISKHDLVIVCLPTPQSLDGHADLTILNRFVDEFANTLNRPLIVVIKSTVPVGTTDLISSKLFRHGVKVVSNPEFLREGRAVHDFFFPDRIVIGAEDANAADSLEKLYKSIDAQVLRCDSKSAELIKYSSNCYLAMRLSFVNSIASISALANADAFSVLEGIGLDKRIGSEFLSPGPGWGGSCFPKDTAALIAIANDLGFEFVLMEATVRSNYRQKNSVAERAVALLDGSVLNKKIAVLGLTFKAGTDDLRDSPSLKIIEMLCDKGAKITAYDPAIGVSISEKFQIATSIENACLEAELVLVLTEWDEFRDYDPICLENLVTQKIVLDTRSVVDPNRWIGAGFTCLGLAK